MKSIVRLEILTLVSALAMLHCTEAARENGPFAGGDPGGGAGAGAYAGTGGVTGGVGETLAGTGGVAGTVDGTSGMVVGSGGQSGGGAGAAAIGGGTGGTPPAGSGGDGGGGVTGGTGGDPVNLAPSTRNPAYASLAPPMGEPLPQTTAGTWTYQEVDGAISRDGSPAGFYFKYSTSGSKNLMVYLVGGGACQDAFFCGNNPPNKNFSLTAESAMNGIFNMAGPDPEAQDPTLPKWQSGIFKDDPSNPVRDWNMVYIPYVTGDVYAGVKPNGTVPGVTGTFQFVGKNNMLKFIGRIVPTFADAPVVLVTGSSAGGIGAVINSTYFADAFIDQGHGVRMFFVDDAGPIFSDQYLEVCLQQRWREIWGLNDSLPADCAGCFQADGGGMVSGLLGYLADKYPDNLLGGLIDSDDDEIMEMFFADELNGCTGAAPFSLWSYPQQRYKDGLKDLIDNHMERMSSYVWAGRLHQNLFQTASGDRFYQKNGLSKTVAEWLTTVLSGQEEHLGAP